MGRIDTYPTSPTIVPVTASSLAYAQVTANQTGITTSAVDLTGLSVTFTVPAGRRIRITAKADFAQTVATVNVVEMRLMEGSTQLQRAKLGDPDAQSESLVLEHTITPSAGSHTYRLTAFTDAGTVSMVAAGNLPAFIHVEDVTGSQLSTTPAQFIPVGTLGFAQRFGNQTGIGTTPVVIGGLSVNIAIPAGRTIKVTGFLPTFTKTSGAPTWVRAYIRRSGTDVQRTIESATNDTFTAMTIELVESPAAGSYTYEILCDTDTGTVALDLGSIGTGANAFILVEDVTATPTPASGAPGSTLGYAQVTANQGSIGGAFVDLTGLSVSVTVPAGRRIKVTGVIRLDNNQAALNLATLGIREGSTLLNRFDTLLNSSGSSGEVGNLQAEWVGTPTAGLHTYKLSAAVDLGGAIHTMTADPTFPAFILVEDITGAVWPAGSPVTVGMIASEEWLTWNPTFTNLTIGSGVTVAKYVEIGRTVHFLIRFTLGAGSAVGTGPTFTLPVPPSSAYATFNTIGVAHFIDAGINDYSGEAVFINGSTVRWRPMDTSGTYARSVDATATIPFTWGSGDALWATGTYEAA